MKEAKKQVKRCQKYLIEVCFDSQAKTDARGERVIILNEVIKCNDKVLSRRTTKFTADALGAAIMLRLVLPNAIDEVEFSLANAARDALAKVTDEIAVKTYGLDTKTPFSIAQQAKFLCVYNRLYPLWKDARNLYKANKNHSQWRRFIKTAHPELPDTLVARLKTKERARYEDTPAELALQHTAALFGLQSYTPRHLKRLLKEWKESFPEPEQFVELLEKLENSVTRKRAS